MLENDKARDVVFSVGEWVLLGTNNLAQHYFQRQERKFRPAFIGPFRVTERVSEYTYRLDLPQKFRRLHPIFHATMLKSCKGARGAGGQEEGEPEGEQEDMGRTAEGNKKGQVADNDETAVGEGTTSTAVEADDRSGRTLEPSAELQRLLGIVLTGPTERRGPEERGSQGADEKDGGVVQGEDDLFYFHEVLDRKPTRRRGVFKYLIRWQGFDEQDDSWVTKKEAVGEDAKQMLREFDKKCER